MDKKSKITIITSIVALAIVIITVTYAYFSARITGIESASTISLTAGTMGIHYEEGNEEVTFTNIYPKEEAWVTKTFTLTGNNATDLKMNYIVGLDIQTNTFQDGYLFYSLENTKNDGGTPIANKNYIKIASSGKQYFGYGQFLQGNGIEHKYTLKIYFPDTGKEQNEAQGAVFNAKIFVIDGGTEETLPSAVPENWYSAADGTLLAAIRNDKLNKLSTPTDIPGKDIAGTTLDITTATISDNNYKICYYDEYGILDDYDDNPALWDAYESNNDQIPTGTYDGVTCGLYSDLYNNMSGKYVFDDNYGLYDDFVYSAGPDRMLYSHTEGDTSSLESLLAPTEDDYGTSYYYRGTVENNYVKFAGMCWRIVRIVGDGSIKLVLSNYNKNLTNPCSTANDNDTAAFARINSDTYTSAFNTYPYNSNGNLSNGALDFVRSKTFASSDYSVAHSNDEDSTILTALKSWYDSVFNTTQKSQLADVIWCNDIRPVSDTSYNPLDFQVIGTGANTDTTYYAAYKRWVSPNGVHGEGTGPSLRCGETLIDNKLGKFTANDGIYGNADLDGYKIGLLTVDEVLFSGAGRAANNTYYLAKNIGSKASWTLSPAEYQDPDGPMLFIYAKSVGFMYPLVSSLAVRPSIALNSSVTISSGNGTSENPYVIN